jgi:hypothetical protein
MSSGRYHHTATLLPDGRVLVAGGLGPGGYVATAEIYDPEYGSVPVVSITALDGVASEAGSNRGTFKISRSSGTASDLIVRYRIRGTATNGVDYRRVLQSTRINAGESSRVIVIRPLDDKIAERNEVVLLVIQESAEGLYKVGKSNKAFVRIMDND